MKMQDMLDEARRRFKPSAWAVVQISNCYLHHGPEEKSELTLPTDNESMDNYFLAVGVEWRLMAGMCGFGPEVFDVVADDEPLDGGLKAIACMAMDDYQLAVLRAAAQVKKFYADRGAAGRQQLVDRVTDDSEGKSRYARIAGRINVIRHDFSIVVGNFDSWHVFPRLHRADDIYLWTRRCEGKSS